MSHDAELAKILLDLDRCEHGRKSIDPCFSCPDGHSTGNPHMKPGQVIGYGISGSLIVMPSREIGEDIYDPAAWRAPRPGGAV